MRTLISILLAAAPALAFADGPNSMIGDVARDSAGNVLNLSFAKAQRYCVERGSRLPIAAEYVDFAMSRGAFGGKDDDGDRTSLSQMLSQHKYLSSYFDWKMTELIWEVASSEERAEADNRAIAAASSGNVFFGKGDDGWPYIFAYSSSGYSTPASETGEGYYWFGDASHGGKSERDWQQVFSAQNGNFVRTQTALESIQDGEARAQEKLRVRCVVRAGPPPSSSIEVRAVSQALKQHFQITDLKNSIGLVGLRQPANPLYRVANWGHALAKGQRDGHIFRLTFFSGQPQKSKRDCYALIDSSDPCAAAVSVFACDTSRILPISPGSDESWSETINLCNL